MIFNDKRRFIHRIMASHNNVILPVDLLSDVRRGLSSNDNGILVPDYAQHNFLERRKLFLMSLLRLCDYEIYERGTSKYNSWVFWRPYFKVYTLPQHPEELDKSVDGEYFDGYNFNKDWNTRDILLSEVVVELEKGKTFEENIRAFWYTVDSLIKYKVHFAVFYAEGMRCPHVHAYGVFPDAKDWAEKELATILFLRKIVPFEYFHLLDTALFGEHTIALEFCKHYKYGTMNKLVFEYVPEVQNAV